MTYVVLGGAGFIGSHLTEMLLNLGNQVLVVDDLSSGSVTNLEEFHTDDRLRFLVHDIRNPLDIADHVDGIFHLASPASPVRYSELPIHTLMTGSLGTYNALKLAQQHSCRIVLASTSEVYGEPLVHPQPESYWGNVNPIGLRSCYDEAKRFSEALHFAFHRAEAVDIGVARIFNTYGPRLAVNDGRVVSNLIWQALNGQDLTVYGDGSQTRSFCYVSDQVEGLLRLMQSNVNGPVNIGNPEEFTVIDLAHLVLKVTKSKSKIVFRDLPSDDPTQRQPDIGLARKLLGWRPKISLQDGLRMTADWYQRKLDQ